MIKCRRPEHFLLSLPAGTLVFPFSLAASEFTRHPGLSTTVSQNPSVRLVDSKGFWTGVAPGIFRRGLTLPTRGLKSGFQGTINAKNIRKNRVSPSDGGLACSDGGL